VFNLFEEGKNIISRYKYKMKDGCNPKVPDCFNPKGIDQMGMNPLEKGETASENAFDNRYVELGMKNHDGLVQKGGKRKSKLYRLKDIVHKCPKKYSHVHFYGKGKTYSSHGIEQKDASKIVELMKNSGFTTKMDRHTLGGASIHGKRKSRRLSRKKRGGGGGFRLGVDSQRIGGLAEVQDYNCHELVKSMKGGDGHAVENSTATEGDTSVIEVDTSTLDIPKIPAEIEVGTGVDAEVGSGVDAEVGSGVDAEVGSGVEDAMVGAGVEDGGADDAGADPVADVDSGAGDAGADSGMDDSGMDNGADVDSGADSVDSGADPAVSADVDVATENSQMEQVMDSKVVGEEEAMGSSVDPVQIGGKRRLSKTLRKLCCLKKKQRKNNKSRRNKNKSKSKSKQRGGNGIRFNLSERIGGLPEVSGYKPCQVDGCESKRVMDAVSQEGGKKRKNTRHRNIVINTKKLSRRRQAKIVVKKN